MKKLGRPVKAARDRRRTFIRLRLTDGEFKAVSAAADKAGLNISEYARQKLIGR